MENTKTTRQVRQELFFMNQQHQVKMFTHKGNVLFRTVEEARHMLFNIQEQDQVCPWVIVSAEKETLVWTTKSGKVCVKTVITQGDRKISYATERGIPLPLDCPFVMDIQSALENGYDKSGEASRSYGFRIS